MSKKLLDEIQGAITGRAEQHAEAREYADQMGEAVTGHIKGEIQSKHDARVYFGYIVSLMFKHYGEDGLKYHVTAEERMEYLKFLRDILDESDIRIAQDNHEDGSITVRLEITTKEKEDEKDG